LCDPTTVAVLQFSLPASWGSLSGLLTGIASFAAATGGALLGLGVWIGIGLVAIGIVWRRRRARTIAIGLEVVCLLGSSLLLLVPIGANNGPVSLMVNIGLPVAVIVLLRKSAGGEAFS